MNETHAELALNVNSQGASRTLPCLGTSSCPLVAEKKSQTGGLPQAAAPPPVSGRLLQL